MLTNFAGIHTSHLVLRRFEKGDLAEFMTYCQLPELQRYAEIQVRDKTDGKRALDLFRTQVSLQRPGDSITFAIVENIDHGLIGHVSLCWRDATAGQGELKIVLNPTFRSRGYASEVASAMMDMAFGQFGMHRIFMRCEARNSHGIKLAQRLGMRLEAHYREHALFQGEWDEELHFAILDREWRRSSKVRELTHRVA